MDDNGQDEVVAGLRAAGCVWAEEEAALLIESATSKPDLDSKVERRKSGEPLELVLGWAAFRGLRIGVSPGVFIPRRRTEFLAGQAITAARGKSVVVELCCGAGAISAALLTEAGPGLELYAADLDPVAVEQARVNLAPLGSATLLGGDLFGPLPATLHGRVDVLVANVPYVPTGDLAFLPAESRLHEPGPTVDGGDDGLSLFRRLIRGAGDWLAPGGHVLSEVSARQVPLAKSIIAAQGLVSRVAEDDDLGATVVIGVREA